jgi:iron complex transport system ATP-binding protein
VRETVALGLSPHVAKLGSNEWTRVDTALARVGITDLAARLVSALSGGERQKVFLALLLAQSTPVLLLDEPTSHMDLAFIPQFYGILREEAAAGKAILLITHDVTEAFSNADRVALLANGSLAFSGTTAEALEQEIPEKHFGLTRYVAQRGEKTAVFFKTE